MAHPRIGKHLAAVTKQLRYSTNPCHDGQKIGVSGPPRDDVLVQVRGNPSATRCPLVDAHVEPLRMGDLLKRPDGILGELGHLDNFLLGRVDICSDVTVGAHQHVPGPIGVEVHDDVTVFATVDNKSVLVAASWGSTERAAILRSVASRLILTRDIRLSLIHISEPTRPY